MEGMGRMTPEIEQPFTANEERRARLAALSFHEKVQAVVQMQQMTAPLFGARLKHVRIWELLPSEF